MKAKLTKLISKYEHDLTASTGRAKKEYIGHIGDIALSRNFDRSAGMYVDLYDIKFPDGAMFCVEKEQLELLKG